MNAVKIIAKDEWRYWQRSKLAKTMVILGAILAIASTFLTAKNMTDIAHERTHLQSKSENTFYSQPDRHPHRMVHYGHYAFRAPPPLGIIDPGIDAYTGNSIFLEGHRQNSSMFADRQTRSELSIFGSLSPAFLLQTIAPLLLILIGYNVITREREAKTLGQLIAQGVTPIQLLVGKGAALGSVAFIMTLPLLAAAIFATVNGESAVSSGFFLIGYLLYLLIWCLAISLTSAVARTPTVSLGSLLAVWVVAAILIPRISGAAATNVIDAPGKIESDFAVIAAIKEVGDGHNAADPAFTALRANLLQQYNVDRIEDLPINFRGVVAGVAEADLTDVLNKFAEKRMRIELEQARVARHFGWVSPVLSIKEFSMALAGVDLETHHRFLRETEQLRFDFVQSLNKLHAENLAYADDANRSSDPEAEKRTRLSAENWRVLEEFNFSPLSVSERLNAALAAFIKLLIWTFGLAMVSRWVAGRVL